MAAEGSFNPPLSQPALQAEPVVSREKSPDGIMDPDPGGA